MQQSLLVPQVSFIDYVIMKIRRWRYTKFGPSQMRGPLKFIGYLSFAIAIGDPPINLFVFCNSNTACT